LTGLQPAQVRFAIAKLVPGTNGGPSAWQSYVNTVEQPGTPAVGAVAWWGTTPTRQATAEVATTAGAVLTDNKDGTYSYKFAKDLAAYTPADAQGPAVTYDATLTHRVGLELRGTGANATNNAINNPVYTYLPATGATTGLFTRDIVNDAECDACHDKLQFHGGPRTDVQYCVICHNPGTTDAQSGNTLDLKVMVHRIHSGVTLPTVVAAGSTAPAPGVGYVIWGFGKTLYNFSTIRFPQDKRNCTTCHRASDPSTPDANNYQNVPNAVACGACHDNVNFATGNNHSAANLPVTDGDCVTCHGPNAAQAGGGWTVAVAHQIPEKVAGTKFQYNILSVTDPNGQPLADGGQLKITFSVADPTNGNAPYNLLTASPFAGTDGGGLVCRSGGPARLSIDVAWSTSDYTNFGSGALPAQPWSLNPLGTVTGCPAEPAATLTGPDASGVFTLVTKKAGGLPKGIGSVGIVFEGHPAVDTQNAGTAAGTSWQRIAVKNTVTYAKVNDAAAVARRNVVAIAKCDECHNALSLHGNNRTDNPQACVACHNPGATDAGRRKGITNASGVVTGVDPVDGLYEQSIDFKYMIHAIHGAAVRAAQGAAPFRVYGFGGSLNDFGDVGFPGAINNCEGCHIAGAYYPVDGSKVQATTFSTGTAINPKNPNPVAATSANMAICSACHTTSVATAHMLQNGGSRTVAKDAFGRTIPSGTVETCGLCHGPGQVADVKDVHKVGQYLFN
jgi:OmcA/MtrC family decaheme c-type cytochrome